MRKKKKDRSHRADETKPPHTVPEAIEVGGPKELESYAFRAFPGPGSASGPLRIAFRRESHAAILAHADKSPEAEICGVLVGAPYEDEKGLFIEVEAIIEGEQTGSGATHVTFTQDTWNQIHAELNERFPRKHIVGWYHSHPGFGVQFSDMDLFIQENFFSARYQCAFVRDPIRGQTAICANRPGGTVAVERYWVEGREFQCHGGGSASLEAGMPGGETVAGSGGTGTGSSTEERLAAVEARLSQNLEVLDVLRDRVSVFMFGLGFLICLMIASYFAYQIMDRMSEKRRPPEMLQTVPIPIEIGDQKAFLGVAITRWDIPEALRADLVELMTEEELQELEKRKSELEAVLEALKAEGRELLEANPPARDQP